MTEQSAPSFKLWWLSINTNRDSLLFMIPFNYTSGQKSNPSCNAGRLHFLLSRKSAREQKLFSYLSPLCIETFTLVLLKARRPLGPTILEVPNCGFHKTLIESNNSYNQINYVTQLLNRRYIVAGLAP